MEAKSLLTARETAYELGIQVGTVHNAFQEDRLPLVALHGRKLITSADLEAYRHWTGSGGESLE